MTDTFGPFLDDVSPLSPGDAAAAIILIPDGRYLLQLRDRKPGIFFPGCWGCFGGGVDRSDEDAEACLRRELKEELNLDLPPNDLSYFCNFTFDLSFCGAGVIYRVFYEVRLSEQQVIGLSLREGSALRSFSARDALSSLHLTPYDAFALWMHASRHRLIPVRQEG